MKKLLFSLLLVLVVTTICLYLFIPAVVKVSDVTVVNCTINGTNRYLLDTAKWQKWWPQNAAGESPGKDAAVFTYGGFSYQVTRPLYNGLAIIIKRGDVTINSVIHSIQLSPDSVAIQWQYNAKTSVNPVTRWQQYQRARTIKKGMGELLGHLQSFLKETVNVYEIDIQEIFSRDTTLISTKQVSDHYPGTAEIYGLIEKLRKHILTENARQTNYPMLHVRKVGKGQYETMVAIPVNKPLKENDQLVNKRFVPWKTLVAETRGGVYKIGQTYEKMKLFVDDYQRTPMAIPFELLITDRSAEPDTLKWITVICQPVS